MAVSDVKPDSQPSPETAERSNSTAERDTAAPRMWPALAIVVAGLVAFAGSAVLAFGEFWQLVVLFLGPTLVLLLLGAWLLLGSRLRWPQRFSLLALFVAACVAVGLLVHPSVQVPYVIYGVPLAAMAAVVFAAGAMSLGGGVLRAGAVLVVLSTLLPWTMLRSEGTTGMALPTFAARWSPSIEDQFLARVGSRKQAPASAVPSVVTAGEGDWTGFRGPNRDSRLRPGSLRTDWNQRPPEVLWRRPMGPAWSSFAVVGNLAITQEQRGETEAVICLNAATGDVVWSHENQARFWESAAGAGPRATPTYHEGRLYTLGGTGILDCLEAASGELVWSRNIAVDNDASVPTWGYAGSPLIWRDTVIVCAGGTGGKSLVAYNLADGTQRWASGTAAAGYGSPQLVDLGGRTQVLIIDHEGVSSYDPDDGTPLWNFDLGGLPGDKTLQPCLVDDQRFLVGMGNGIGTRLFQVSADGQSVGVRWLSNRLKPKFSDIVTRDGYVYGLDTNILTCLSVEDGSRVWKGGRYGSGQLLLMGEWLIVIAEDGDLALVRATPEGYDEVLRLPALEGKTWNHPAAAGGKLLLRNAQQAVCLELSPDAA